MIRGIAHTFKDMNGMEFFQDINDLEVTNKVIAEEEKIYRKVGLQISVEGQKRNFSH